MEHEETQAFRVLAAPVIAEAEFGTSQPGAGHQVHPLRILQSWENKYSSENTLGIHAIGRQLIKYQVLLGYHDRKQIRENSNLIFAKKNVEPPSS